LCSLSFWAVFSEGNHGLQSQGKHQVNVNPRLLKLLQIDDPTTNKKALQDFFLVLAICNTVVPIKVDDGDPIQKKIPKIEYQAESPDEQALVTAAAAYGYVLMERSTRHVVVAVQGELQRYFYVLFAILSY
jgi:phospholipid-transporting ATPase